MSDVLLTTSPEYHNRYLAEIAHQRHHDELGVQTDWRTGREQPSRTCIGCARAARSANESLSAFGRADDLIKRYSWAIPDRAALELIAQHSPRGVVEIGAGGGYWAYELQRFGVDVVAYDPDPLGVGEHAWHAGQPWTEVHEGNHTKVADHPDRTLLIVWPSYGAAWAADALDIYCGDTVVYVGEGHGGCTADDRFHTLVGDGYCWHHDTGANDECNCPTDEPQWGQVADHDIPQWWGIHDRLHVYKRLTSRKGPDD